MTDIARPASLIAQAFLAAAFSVGACTVQSASDEAECEPHTEEVCTCSSGADGMRICNFAGTGWNACECASGGTGGEAGGGGSGAPNGAGGSSSSAGGTLSGGVDAGGGKSPDAGATELDAGATDAASFVDALESDGSLPTIDATVLDVATPTDSGTIVDAAEGGALVDAPAEAGNACLVGDAGGLDACNLCIFQNCCEFALACVEPDPCDAEGDAGFDEAECMDVCLLTSLEADAGTIDDVVFEECATACASSGDEISTVTYLYMGCLAAECEPECYPQ